MKLPFKHTLLIAACISIGLHSCSSDNGSNAQNTLEFGDLTLNFSTTVGEVPLQMDDIFYQKNGNETFTITELKYIVSNIVLIDDAGNEFAYPQAESYFLINEELQASKSITLENIDANRYTSIRFGIGVDQSNYPLNGVNNFVPTAQDQNMTWSWSAGYIFFRLEGKYTSPTNIEENYNYHMGSHGTSQDNYREVWLNLQEPIDVTEDLQAQVYLKFDLLKVFESTYSLNLREKDDVQVDPVNAPKIAENITNAFEIKLN